MEICCVKSYEMWCSKNRWTNSIPVFIRMELYEKMNFICITIANILPNITAISIRQRSGNCRQADNAEPSLMRTTRTVSGRGRGGGGGLLEQHYWALQWRGLHPDRKIAKYNSIELIILHVYFDSIMQPTSTDETLSCSATFCLNK